MPATTFNDCTVYVHHPIRPGVDRHKVRACQVRTTAEGDVTSVLALMPRKRKLSAVQYGCSVIVVMGEGPTPPDPWHTTPDGRTARHQCPSPEWMAEVRALIAKAGKAIEADVTCNDALGRLSN